MKPDKSTRILNAAIKLFAEKGYQYTTIADIAREAGVAKGLVHVYFASKLDVLLEVILLFIRTVNERIAAKLAQRTDPVAKLNGVFESFAEIMSRSNADLYWGHILKEGLPDRKALTDARLQEKLGMIARSGRQLQETLDGIIAEGQRQGVIDSSLKPQVIRQMIGGASQMLYQGLALESHGRGSMGYDEADVRTGINALIDKFVVKLT